MNFADISMGTKVQITVNNGGDMQAKFVSRVMQSGNKGLLVIPFMHKGVRVNFAGENIRIHLQATDAEGNNWTFKNCHIATVRKDGLVYHRIVSSMTTGIENRRGEKRTYVWQPAVFSIEGVVDQVFTTLKDVSPSGFAFVLDPKKRVQITMGTGVTCTFNDRGGQQIRMKGKIIRKERTDQYVLYGCRSPEQNQDVMDYLARLSTKKDENDNEQYMPK